MFEKHKARKQKERERRLGSNTSSGFSGLFGDTLFMWCLLDVLGSIVQGIGLLIAAIFEGISS